MFCSPGPCRSVILTTGKLVPSEWFTIFRPFVYIVYAVQNKKREKKTNTIFNGFFTLSLSLFLVWCQSLFPTMYLLCIFMESTHPKRGPKKSSTKNHTIGISIFSQNLNQMWCYICIHCNTILLLCDFQMTKLAYMVRTSIYLSLYWPCKAEYNLSSNNIF